MTDIYIIKNKFSNETIYYHPDIYSVEKTTIGNIEGGKTNNPPQPSKMINKEKEVIKSSSVVDLKSAYEGEEIYSLKTLNPLRI